MPALYALGQHEASVAVSERLLLTELLLFTTMCADVHVLQQALWEHSRIQVHHGKTQLWNPGGEAPRGWRALTAAARLVDPDAIVWRRDHELPLPSRGRKCLARWIILRVFLRNSSTAHKQLLERIPCVVVLLGAGSRECTRGGKNH